MHGCLKCFRFEYGFAKFVESIVFKDNSQIISCSFLSIIRILHDIA